MKSLASESMLLQSHLSIIPFQARQEEWLSHSKLKYRCSLFIQMNVMIETLILNQCYSKVTCSKFPARLGIYKKESLSFSKRYLFFFSSCLGVASSGNCIVLLILTVIVLCMDSLINSFYLFLYSDVQCC